MDEPHVYDVVVVGGGVIGAAAAAAAAKILSGDISGLPTGGGVVLIDQYGPDHTNGSSHGDGRIFRVAYEEEDYIALAQAAYQGWRQLEQAVSEELLHTTGGITTACKEELSSLDELGATFERLGVEHERLDADSVAQRFPQFRLGEGEEAIYQRDSGVLRASRCVGALWRHAAALGATTLAGHKMTHVEPMERGGQALVRVTATRCGDTGAAGQDGSAAPGESVQFYGRSVILTLGGWAASFLSDVGIPLSVSREVVAYYPPLENSPVDHSYRCMPVFICRTPSGLHNPHHPAGDQGFYGLPQIDVGGVKAAAHHVGPLVTPGQPLTAQQQQDVEERHQQCVSATSFFVSRLLPLVSPTPLCTLGCLYTSTPDHDFVIGPHPALPNVFVGAGFSGHGFKFAPAIGSILAQLALHKPIALPLKRFDPSRFIREGRGAAGEREGTGAQAEKGVPSTTRFK